MLVILDFYQIFMYIVVFLLVSSERVTMPLHEMLLSCQAWLVMQVNDKSCNCQRQVDNISFSCQLTKDSFMKQQILGTITQISYVAWHKTEVVWLFLFRTVVMKEIWNKETLVKLII